MQYTDLLTSVEKVNKSFIYSLRMHRSVLVSNTGLLRNIYTGSKYTIYMYIYLYISYTVE